MATYVLVHGAWGGSWLWTPTARALRAQGHEVWTPSLTGLGERIHLAHGGIDLSTHIADVANLIRFEELEDIVLVGHSYGGMVVTGVAGQLPERVRTLVYLDAFLPKDGEALWDIADDAARQHYIDGQRGSPGLSQPFFPQGEGNARRLSGHPLLTLTEPVRTGGAEARVPNRTYIYATRDAPTVFTKFYEEVRGDMGWKVREVATGHVVMLDDLDGLVAMLLEEAER